METAWKNLRGMVVVYAPLVWLGFHRLTCLYEEAGQEPFRHIQCPTEGRVLPQVRAGCGRVYPEYWSVS